jgi:ketosteroid isomerase-like protein
MSSADTATQALARRWADAINARDIDALVPLAHPDIELEPLQIGVRGQYHGPEGVRRWMEEVAGDDLGHRVRIEGTRSLGPGRALVRGTVLLGGDEVSPYALVVHVRDGLVLGMRSYLNDEATLERLGVL